MIKAVKLFGGCILADLQSPLVIELSLLLTLMYFLVSSDLFSYKLVGLILVGHLTLSYLAARFSKVLDFSFWYI